METPKPRNFKIYIDLFDDGAKQECAVATDEHGNFKVSVNDGELCTMMQDDSSGLWVVIEGNVEQWVVDEITEAIEQH